MLRIIALAPLFLALTACPPPKPKLTPDGIPVREAHVIKTDNDLIDFSYGWSKEVSGVLALSTQFGLDARNVEDELTEMARDGKAFAEESGHQYNRYFHSTEIVTAGSSNELLSLRQTSGFYTGGAHPNSFTKAHYWDRMEAKNVETPDLFIAGALESFLTERFCPALNAERFERRGEVFGDGIFDECPKANEVSLIANDEDKNLLFERMVVVADPYVAGPYAEGRYEIELMVDETLIAGLKPAYRASFEVSGQ